MYSMVAHHISHFVGYKHCLIYIVTRYQSHDFRHEKCKSERVQTNLCMLTKLCICNEERGGSVTASPEWQQKAIKNIFSSNFLSAFVDC